MGEKMKMVDGRHHKNGSGDRKLNIVDSGSFYSRGKLLLTAEYLVLHGASALALPARKGQRLKYDKQEDRSAPEQRLLWQTNVLGDSWFEASFRGPGYLIESATHNGRAGLIRHILSNAAELSGSMPLLGVVLNELEFDSGWGLGSSSSLISNVAYLFDLNPFALHFAVSKGSGYDIACARSDTPIVYRLEYQTDNYHTKKVPAGHISSFAVPAYRNVEFSPPFHDQLYFVYTGKKQDSEISVEKFLANRKPSEEDISAISEITAEILKTGDLKGFTELLREHDRVISTLLKQQTVNDTIFGDSPGYFKSLGAWGGDFLLVVWEDGVDELKQMLKQKGMEVVIPYKKLVF